jgi:hypothetical protein
MVSHIVSVAISHLTQRIKSFVINLIALNIPRPSHLLLARRYGTELGTYRERKSDDLCPLHFWDWNGMVLDSWTKMVCFSNSTFSLSPNPKSTCFNMIILSLLGLFLSFQGFLSSRFFAIGYLDWFIGDDSIPRRDSF